MDVTNITDFLNAHGIKPSYQRIKVYEHLLQCKNHPTAEMIYRELVKIIPTLSKTTVYNSLKTFVEKGIVRVVTIDGNEMHYDPILEEHGHFQCRRCRKLYNFPIDKNLSFADQVKDYIIEERSIYLKGICKSCIEKEQS